MTSAPLNFVFDQLKVPWQNVLFQATEVGKAVGNMVREDRVQTLVSAPASIPIFRTNTHRIQHLPGDLDRGVGLGFILLHGAQHDK